MAKIEHKRPFNGRGMGKPGKGPIGKAGKGGPHSKQKQNGKKEKLRSTKNKIRGLQRLLLKEDLDPKVRIKKQAEIAELLKVQENKQQSDLERKYSVMYHRIRFFERQKVDRRLKKLKKKEETAALSDQDKQELQQLQSDMVYIMFFPKGEKYVSLLKDAEDPEAQAKLVLERSRLRGLAHARQRELALVAEADEGLSLAASVPVGAGVGDEGGLGEAGGKLGAEGGAKEEAEEDDFFLSGSDDEGGSVGARGVVREDDVSSLSGDDGDDDDEGDDNEGGEEKEGTRGVDEGEADRGRPQQSSGGDAASVGGQRDEGDLGVSGKGCKGDDGFELGPANSLPSKRRDGGARHKDRGVVKQGLQMGDARHRDQGPHGPGHSQQRVAGGAGGGGKGGVHRTNGEGIRHADQQMPQAGALQASDRQQGSAAAGWGDGAVKKQSSQFAGKKFGGKSDHSKKDRPHGDKKFGKRSGDGGRPNKLGVQKTVLKKSKAKQEEKKPVRSRAEGGRKRRK